MLGWTIHQNINIPLCSNSTQVEQLLPITIFDSTPLPHDRPLHFCCFSHHPAFCSHHSVVWQGPAGARLLFWVNQFICFFSLKLFNNTTPTSCTSPRKEEASNNDASVDPAHTLSIVANSLSTRTESVLPMYQFPSEFLNQIPFREIPGSDISLPARCPEREGELATRDGHHHKVR